VRDGGSAKRNPPLVERRNTLRYCALRSGHDRKSEIRYFRSAMDNISALQQSLANWDRLGTVAAAVVLLGVVLIAVTQFEWLIRWSGLERMPRWQWPIGKVGALLVIAGLAGEIVTVGKSRAINERIAAQLNAQAAVAHERARTLEKDAAELRLQLARLKWRIISPEQQATLVDLLKAAPKGPVIVFHVPEDEPRSYAMQVGEALRAAGYDAKVEQSPAALNLAGTFLLVHDLQRPPAHAVGIQKAFREIHVDLDGQQDQHVADVKAIVILIGSRRL